MTQFTMETSASGAMALNVSGDLTIQHAQALKEALMDAIGQVDHLVLRLEGVTGADLAGLQLLCAAQRHMLDRKKKFSVEGKIPSAFHEAVMLAGYVKCAGGADNSGIWKGVAD